MSEICSGFISQLVSHMCVIELSHHRFRQWLVTCLAQSYSLNQCWLIETNKFWLSKLHSKLSVILPPICSGFHVLRPNDSLRPNDAYLRLQANQPVLVLTMAWRLNHYLNQCWNIVNSNWTLRHKLQWNRNRNSYIFIKNAFENIGWQKMRPFCLGLNVLLWILSLTLWASRATWRLWWLAMVIELLAFGVNVDIRWVCDWILTGLSHWVICVEGMVKR